MLKCYKTNLRRKVTEEIVQIEPDCWIDLVTPNEKEIDSVVAATEIDRDLIVKMLDDDELPRVETSGNATLVVIDVPAYGGKNRNITYPLGIIVTTNNYFITIAPKTTPILNSFRNNKVRNFRTAKKTRFLIQILNVAAAQYIKVLDEVYSDIENKETTLKRSTENEDLIDLLQTEKTLVYFTSSLKENDMVLERLSKGVVLPLYEGDLDLLEDAMIENRQAIDMARIYRDILSSITNTYATVISNNLNNVMKFLAGITIVLSVPTMISSFLGMNVNFGASVATDPYGPAIILGISIVASVVIAIWLNKKDLL
ncbi:MAG: magnesium transporter CorA family protein [Candidatus Nanosyncoccaceae bacterium]